MLFNQLKSKFSPDLISRLTSSAFALDDLNLTDEERDMVSGAYMNGIRAVFISFAALIAAHLCFCMCITDYGLARGSKQQQEGRVGEYARADSARR